MLREALIDGRFGAGVGIGKLHAHGIVSRKITFVDQLADALLAQIVVAFVDRNFIDPGK